MCHGGEVLYPRDWCRHLWTKLCGWVALVQRWGGRLQFWHVMAGTRIWPNLQPWMTLNTWEVAAMMIWPYPQRTCKRTTAQLQNSYLPRFQVSVEIIKITSWLSSLDVKNYCSHQKITLNVSVKAKVKAWKSIQFRMGVWPKAIYKPMLLHSWHWTHWLSQWPITVPCNIYPLHKEKILISVGLDFNSMQIAFIPWPSSLFSFLRNFCIFLCPTQSEFWRI